MYSELIAQHGAYETFNLNAIYIITGELGGFFKAMIILQEVCNLLFLSPSAE